MRKEKTKKGDTYGKLVAVEYSHTSSRVKHWKFLCTLCNKEHIQRLPDVRRGKVKSCGCRLNTAERNGQWKGYNGLHGRTVGHYKLNAEKRNIPFNVTAEYLWSVYLKQNKKCPYTAIELNLYPENGNHRTPVNASLDRIDSKKGYIEDNLQWVYKPINVFKNSMSKESFINMCKLVSNNHE